MRYVEFHKYVNVNRVVIVDKDRLYGVHRRYETTRDVKIVKEVVNNGRAAPIVTRDVVKGADLKMEHHFARSGDFSRKPNADGVSEIAARRRGGSGGTQTAQGTGEGIQKASLRPSDTKGGQPSATKAGDDNKRNLPATPRELKREERQERRLETKGDRGAKEGPGQQQQHQQKQQLVKEQQQQRGQQDPQQRRQQQLEQRQQQQAQRQQQQQQQQLAHQQQQAQRQQQQAERQQQIQAQRQQQQAQQQQQAAQRQQQAQAQQQQQAQRQQQQGQQRQNQKHAHQQ